MPSKTFFNLSKEKQNRLLTIAMEEFSKNSYYKVSINKIIRQAEISRGSFYMYFENKEDLFSYLLDKNKKSLENLMVQITLDKKGDLRDTFIDLYDRVVPVIIKKRQTEFFKNIFIYFNLHRKELKPPGYNLFLIFKDNVDTKNLKTNDIEFVFFVFFHALLIAIMDAIKENSDNNRADYLQKIDMLCYGVYC